jgi:hypothetical protein
VAQANGSSSLKLPSYSTHALELDYEMEYKLLYLY